jgi:hypothetical protein
MIFEVKTLTGRKLVLDTNDYTTITEIKSYIQEKEGIEIRQIRLISQGRSLNDNENINDIIKPEAKTIHMVLALRGG